MKNLLPLLVLIFCCGCAKENERKTIAIQPYGIVEQEILDTLKSTIKREYGFKAYVLPSVKLPKEAFVKVKSARYRADKLIALLKTNKPDSLDLIIGVTNSDISTTKKDKQGNPKQPAYKYEDWGIIGLGYRPGPTCIVSTFRIKAKSHTKFIDRLTKVCIHEIGHNLGLKHCTNDPKCVMRDAAETVRTVDMVDAKLCEYCLGRID